MTRIVVSGSRSITDRDHVDWILSRHIRPARDVMVYGACKTGVDQLAKEWAEYWRVQTDPVPVTEEDWEKLGKKAGPLRNRRMLESGEALVAIWDGKSPGTNSAIRIATGLRREIHLYFVEAK